MFQFPTGWNSTNICMFLIQYQKRFNSQRDGILPCSCLLLLAICAGFNSQRDGILPKTLILSTENFMFQFPTGWNSTRIYGNDEKYLTRFQFPTGWNSTETSHRCSATECRVSIPNGMEFYAASPGIGIFLP